MKKLSTILLLGFFSTLVFTSCNNSKGGWTMQDKNAWMTDCKNAMGTDENSSKVCNCMLTKMEKDYANYNDANTRGGEQLGATLRQQCEKELTGNNRNIINNNNNNNNNNGGGGWTSKDKGAWMNDCKNAMGNGENVNKLCNCMLTKMEKDYANYNDANTRGGEQLGATLRRECEAELMGNGGNDDENGNNNNDDDNNED